MFFTKCFTGNKEKNLDRIRKDFIIFAEKRIDKITDDDDLPEYYKMRINSSYNLAIDFLTNKEDIPRNIIQTLSVDMGEKDFNRYSELLNTRSCSFDDKYKKK